MRSAAGVGIAERFCPYCLSPVARHSLSFPLGHVTPIIPFARIYAGPWGRASAD